MGNTRRGIFGSVQSIGTEATEPGIPVSTLMLIISSTRSADLSSIVSEVHVGRYHLCRSLSGFIASVYSIASALKLFIKLFALRCSIASNAPKRAVSS